MTAKQKTLAILALGLFLSPVVADDNTPEGRWERKMGKSQVSVTFTADRMHLVMTGEESCALHADYHATKDGILYGVFTSVGTEDEEANDELVDHPFSFRFRMDEGMLIVREFKSSADGFDKKNNPLVGRFKLVQAQAHPAACCAPPAPPCYAPVGYPPQSCPPCPPASTPPTTCPVTSYRMSPPSLAPQMPEPTPVPQRPARSPSSCTH